MAKRSDIERALRQLAPHVPAHEFEAAADHAMNSRGLSTASPETAAWLSLVAYVRHVFTEYDDLLAQGYDHDSARFYVRADMETKLNEWGVCRKLSQDD